MMQTGIARHALAVMQPYRFSIMTLYIAHGTQFLTFSAAYTLFAIYGETLVGNEMLVEESTEESAIQTRHCSFVNMLTSTALANPFRELVNSYGCITNLLTFTQFFVEIHKGESNVALWHNGRIGSIEMQMHILQMLLKELHCLTSTISAGA
jgi:hypothetical protein